MAPESKVERGSGADRLKAIQDYYKWLDGEDMTDRDPLLQEREKTHGSFPVTAQAAQELKNVLHRWNTQDVKAVHMEALEMICLKMARALQNPNVKDHWDDIAGYAKLGAEACE